jgi:hypothetical protein
MVRLSAEELTHLDAWIAGQKERLGLELSRPAAIRARLAQSVSAEPTAKPARGSRPAKKDRP